MKKLLKAAAALLTALICAGLFLSALFLYDGVREADRYEYNQPLEQLVAQVEEKETYTPYEQISPMLLQATVAIEDARYYSHGAVDLQALVRAGLSQLIPSMPKSGGSTIAMQVVKNLYGQFEGGVRWKAAEIVLADRLCSICSKEQILALYVNIINYGSGYHGISEASYGYYGLSPMDLNDGMACLLAGVPQNPVLYNLKTNFENARIKEQAVLKALVRNGYMDQTRADAIDAMPCAPAVLGRNVQERSSIMEAALFL